MDSDIRLYMKFVSDDYEFVRRDPAWKCSRKTVKFLKDAGAISDYCYRKHFCIPIMPAGRTAIDRMVIEIVNEQLIKVYDGNCLKT